MTDALLAPFQFAFMAQAFAIAALVAVPTALLSCFVVLKGWSLMGDALSHAVLPGIVLAYVAGLPFTLGAFGAGMVCALSAGWIESNSRVGQDTALGVIFAGMFALGIVLYTAIETEVHLDHILFGDMLGVGPADLWRAAGVAAAVCAAVALRWRDLLLLAFDPLQARAGALAVRGLHYGLLALISLAIVSALAAIGIILTIAMLIAPGAIAFLLVRRFDHMLIAATGIALIAALGGVYLSFFLDSAPAPTVVMLLTVFFLAAFARDLLRVARAQTMSAENSDPSGRRSATP